MVARHRPANGRQTATAVIAASAVIAAGLLTVAAEPAATTRSTVATNSAAAAAAAGRTTAGPARRPDTSVSPYLDARLRGYKAADEALRDMAGYYAPPDDHRAVRTVGPAFPWARDRHAAAEVIANGWPLEPLRPTTWEWTEPHALQFDGDRSPDWRTDGFWDRLSLHLAWYAQGDVADVADVADWALGDRDLVFRASATDRQKCDDLALLIAADTGRPVRVVGRSVSRPCVVVRGPLTGSGLPFGPPPATPEVRHSLIITARPVSRADLDGWAAQLRVSPGNYPAFTQPFDWPGVSYHLHAPLVDDDADGGSAGTLRPDLASVVLLLDKDLMWPKQPVTADQRRQVVANLHLQVGGDWRVEDRPTTMFDLRQDPPTAGRPAAP